MTNLTHTVWRKSSRSGGENGNCIEVTFAQPAVAIRDSKNPNGPTLVLPTAGWDAFQHGVKNGTFDLT
jgi:hypothetical protein